MRPMSGVLLAGGHSRRMGADKALLDVGGEPLAVRVLRVLDRVCDDVVVASGDGSRLGGLGRPQAADPRPGAGPLAGIVAGLLAASHDLVAVLAVDQPDASAAVLARLAAVWAGEAAVVPVVDGLQQPLHAVWSRAAAPSLLARLDRGERAVSPAVAALGARLAGPELWAEADPSGRFARNLNVPADLNP